MTAIILPAITPITTAVFWAAKEVVGGFFSTGGRGGCRGGCGGGISGGGSGGSEA